MSSTDEAAKNSVRSTRKTNPHGAQPPLTQQNAGDGNRGRGEAEGLYLDPFGIRLGASLVAQAVKNLATMQETWVQYLGREDPLKKGMATHSSILAWRIPWMEEPSRLKSMGSQRVGHD